MEEKVSKALLKLSQTIIKLRYWIVALVVLITAFFGYYATKIQVDPDFINQLPDHDPVAKLYKEVGAKYGGNYTAIILLETDNVFTKQVLEDIRKITDTLQNLANISYVTSLTNTIDIRSSEWGIEIGNLVDEYDLPSTPEQLDSLRNYVLSKDMYRNVLVSEDGTLTIIMATIQEQADKMQVAKEIKKAVQGLDLHEKVYYTGVPFTLLDTGKMILKDLRNLIPIVALIIIVMLWFGFKSVRGVVLPLLTVAISTIWTVGLIAFTGHKLSLASDIIPVILLSLGSAYAIHVLNRINETKAANLRQKLILAIAFIVVPVFLAYITTAFGFISFIFGSYLISIKEFGLFTAIGITFAFLLSITFIPSVIEIFKLKRKKEYTATQSQIVTRFLQPVAIGVMKRPKTVIIVSLLIAAIFASAIPKIQRKVDMMSYFKKDSELRIAQEIVNQKLSGAQPVYIVFDGDVQSPEFLKLMKKFENLMKQSSPYIKYTMSVADLIEQMNDAMGEGEKIPDDRAKIEQLWFMLDGQDIMNQLVSPDLDQAIIQSQFASWDTEAAREFVEKMNQYARELSTGDIKIRVTGLPSINVRLDDSVVRSQALSLLLAIALMFTIVSVTMWSARCGAMALTPLLLTIVVLFGVMGLAHIPLDTVTVIVASITLGVGIDYAVHIISHYRNYLKETGDSKQALIETIKISGNAIVINVLSVALGFLVLLFSDLIPIRNLGLLMAVAMIVSGIAAITFLPALIVLMNNKKSADTKSEK